LIPSSLYTKSNQLTKHSMLSQTTNEHSHGPESLSLPQPQSRACFDLVE
jgi:hypothetical protein